MNSIDRSSKGLYLARWGFPNQEFLMEIKQAFANALNKLMETLRDEIKQVIA